MKQRMNRLACLWLAVILLVGMLVMPASAVSYDVIPSGTYFTTEEVVPGEDGLYFAYLAKSLPYGPGAPTIDEFLEANGITEDDMMRDGSEPVGWRIWSSMTSGGVYENAEYFDLERDEALTSAMYNSLEPWQWFEPCIEALYDDPTLEFLGGIILAETEADIHFTDVDEKAWYYDAVVNAASKGWMKGVSPTQFAPDVTLTRAMIWTVLARANGQRTDGDGAWYGIGRQWAMRTGISDGTNPDATLTQEELLTMVWRSVGSPYCVADVSNADVSDWAVEAVRWALANNIVPYDFSPKAAATRAWTAHVMMLA